MMVNRAIGWMDVQSGFTPGMRIFGAWSVAVGIRVGMRCTGSSGTGWPVV